MSTHGVGAGRNAPEESDGQLSGLLPRDPAVPAVVTSGLSGFYLMRLWLAVVAVAILGWAGVLITRPGSPPWPLVGLLLGFTPMVAFTMSTINPSGLEAAFTAPLVAGMLALATAYRRRPEVVAAVVVGAIGMVLVRRDGLVWLSMTTFVLSPVLTTGRAWATAKRNPVRLGVLCVGAVVVGSFAVVAWAPPTMSRFFRNWRDGQGTDMWEAGRYVRTYLYQVVGVFGWLDSPIGEETFLVAMIAAGFVVICSAWSDPNVVWSCRPRWTSLRSSSRRWRSASCGSRTSRGATSSRSGWGSCSSPARPAATAGADDELTRRASRLLLAIWARRARLVGCAEPAPLRRGAKWLVELRLERTGSRTRCRISPPCPVRLAHRRGVAFHDSPASPSADAVRRRCQRQRGRSGGLRPLRAAGVTSG